MNNNKFSNLCISLFTILFVTNIGCFMLSLFMFAISSGSTVRVLVQIINITIALSATYSICHKKGDRDATLVNSGYYKRNNFKGLWAGLIATIPFIATGIMLVISKSTGVYENFIGLYKIINSFYFPFNYSILPVGQTIYEIQWGNIVLSLLTFIIIPVIAMFAYILGLNRYYFNEKIFYKKADSE